MTAYVRVDKRVESMWSDSLLARDNAYVLTLTISSLQQRLFTD